MPKSTGTVRVKQDAAGTKTLIVVGADPPKAFIDPPAWVWDLVRDNAGAALSVDYDEDPGPPPTTTITAVEVG